MDAYTGYFGLLSTIASQYLSTAISSIQNGSLRSSGGSNDTDPSLAPPRPDTWSNNARRQRPRPAPRPVRYPWTRFLNRRPSHGERTGESPEGVSNSALSSGYITIGTKESGQSITFDTNASHFVFQGSEGQEARTFLPSELSRIIDEWEMRNGNPDSPASSKNGGRGAFSLPADARSTLEETQGIPTDFKAVATGETLRQFNNFLAWLSPEQRTLLQQLASPDGRSRKISAHPPNIGVFDAGKGSLPLWSEGAPVNTSGVGPNPPSEAVLPGFPSDADDGDSHVASTGVAGNEANDD